MSDPGEELPPIAVHFSDFEHAKENIQPLKQGRSAAALASLFSSEPAALTDTLQQGHAQFQAELSQAAELDDPLDVYHRYVRWTMENYPQGNCHASNLVPLLEQATRTFREDFRYNNDPRYLKLWLLYAKYVQSPKDIYAYLMANEIGLKLAAFYEDYAEFLEKEGSFPMADEIFQLGINRRAQPLERLNRHFREFSYRMVHSAARDSEGDDDVNARDASRRNQRTEGGRTTNRSALCQIESTVSRARPVSDHVILPSAPSASIATSAARPRVPSVSSNSKMQVFVDPDGDVAAAEMNASKKPMSGVWQDVGTEVGRRKENIREGSKWKGEMLPQNRGGPSPRDRPLEKIEVYRDEVPGDADQVSASTNAYALRKIASSSETAQLMSNPLKNFHANATTPDAPRAKPTTKIEPEKTTQPQKQPHEPRPENLRVDLDLVYVGDEELQFEEARLKRQSEFDLSLPDPQPWSRAVEDDKNREELERKQPEAKRMEDEILAQKRMEDEIGRLNERQEQEKARVRADEEALQHREDVKRRMEAETEENHRAEKNKRLEDSVVNKRAEPVTPGKDFAISTNFAARSKAVASPTINTKAALADIMEMFNQPLKCEQEDEFDGNHQRIEHREQEEYCESEDDQDENRPIPQKRMPLLQSTSSRVHQDTAFGNRLPLGVKQVSPLAVSRPLLKKETFTVYRDDDMESLPERKADVTPGVEGRERSPVEVYTDENAVTGQRKLERTESCFEIFRDGGVNQSENRKIGDTERSVRDQGIIHSTPLNDSVTRGSNAYSESETVISDAEGDSIDFQFDTTRGTAAYRSRPTAGFFNVMTPIVEQSITEDDVYSVDEEIDVPTRFDDELDPTRGSNKQTSHNRERKNKMCDASFQIGDMSDTFHGLLCLDKIRRPATTESGVSPVHHATENVTISKIIGRNEGTARDAALDGVHEPIRQQKCEQAPTRKPIPPPNPKNPCRPHDPTFINAILASLDPGLERYEGYYDVSSTELLGRKMLEKTFRNPNVKRPGGSSVHNTSAECFLDLDRTNRQVCRLRVQRKLGAGGYGTVYLAVDVAAAEAAAAAELAALDLDDDSDFDDERFVATRDGEERSLCAVKLEAPSSAWEFYVLRQLHNRLSKAQDRQPMGKHIENNRSAVIYPRELFLYKDASALLMEFSDQGTLLDAVNICSISSLPGGGTGMDELLAAFFTVEVLRIMETVHSCNIVHADIKADNFLLRLKEPEDGDWASQYDSTGGGGWASKGLTLIDFGRAIDLSVFENEGTDSDRAMEFLADWETDKHDCPEARRGEPWRYQEDYYGMAGIVYCLLHGRYLEVTEDEEEELDERRRRNIDGIHPRLRPLAPYRRYWKSDLWRRLFDLLLNPTIHAPHDRPLTQELQEARRGLETYLIESCNRGGKSLKSLLKKLEIRVLEKKR